jgi:hypothetical protein
LATAIALKTSGLGSSSLVSEEDQFRARATVALRDAVKERMKDPDSIQFRNVEVFHHKAKDVTPAGVYVLCGEVNAKNSYGGYTGFSLFVATVFMRSSGLVDTELSHVSFDDSDQAELYERKGKLKRFMESTYAPNCQDKEIQ